MSVQFTQGVSFTFPDTYTLAPGQYVVAVANPAAFQSRYGGGGEHRRDVHRRAQR